MKKIITLLCMIACVCSFTACGATEVNQHQADKQAFAEQIAVENIIPLMQEAAANEELVTLYKEGAYTNKEWEAVVSNTYGLTVDGAAFLKGLDSFCAATESMGEILELGSVSSQVNDEEIIVNVEVLGDLKNGQVEIILSNDYFGELKSCTLNVDATFEEIITNAALNTVLGMGTVFAVLIFIMLIISSFAIIPKIQNKIQNKGGNDSGKKSNRGNDLELVAAIAAATAYEESKNDTELVAVISAAIAAHRGEATSDGFVVRSIKKIRRR